MVNVSEVEPFSGMLAAPNALIMTGGATTVIEALEVLPVPPSVEVTWTLLFFTPAVVPCTLTETVQLALAAKVPALRLTEPDPATAVAVPPQVLFNALGVATTRPAGRLSVNAIPFSVKLVFGLLMVKVSEVVPFSGMIAAPNALVIEGGVATVKFAEAVLPVPPLVELTAPDVLVYCPDAVAVTFTTRVQLVLTAMLPPVREMLVEPATAVAVPPQVFERPFGVETTSPVGNVSVNATPVSATVFAAGLVMVKVRVVVPFSGIVVGLKALEI